MAKVLGNQQVQPKIDLSQAKDMNCIHCNNKYFIQAVMVKKISRFVTGTANDAVLPIDVLLCGNCGQPLEDLLPKELRKNQQSADEKLREQFPANVEGSSEFNKANQSPTASKLILEP